MSGAPELIAYDGVEPEVLAQRLGVPRCLTLARVSSTLDIIHELAAAGAPSGTLVLADEQSAGRGRQGRPWHSPARAGIWLGYLARPAMLPDGGVLALRVGLAVAEALEDLGVETALKWPNDVLLEDRKLGGVLCEARWTGRELAWVAIGVGLNVFGPPPAGLDGRAAALDEVLQSADRLNVLDRLVPRLRRVSGTPTLTPEELGSFARRDWLHGRRIETPVRGTARGIANDGALLIETLEGLERIMGGSVVTA